MPTPPRNNEPDSAESPPPPAPGPREDLDPITLARFLSGESDAAESVRVQRWIASDSANAAVVDQLRAAWDPAVTAPMARADEWDADRALARVRNQRSIHRVRWRITATAIAAALAGIGILITEQVRHPTLEPAHSYATTTGERLSVTLADGTRMILGPASRASVSMTPGGAGRPAVRREVALEGEAYFVVAYDAARPFAVRAHGAVTEDIGTAFDVRAYPDDPGARIAVAEGEVAVAAPGEPVREQGPVSTSRYQLRAGDVATVRATDVTVTRDADIAALTGWMRGQLVFDNALLSTALADIGRWYDLDIRVPDGGLPPVHVTAAFADESVDQMLHALASALPVAFERRGRTVVVRVTGFSR